MATIKNPLPKRLKEARLAAKISQKTLGITAGIDEFSASARMNQYETGKYTPDFLTLKRIASALNLPTAYFYAEDDNLANFILLFHRFSRNKSKRLFQILENVFNEGI